MGQEGGRVPVQGPESSPKFVVDVGISRELL